jgi:hypothetical protein
MAESESKFAEVSALIPEIYYDIIARLIPGLVTIWINFPDILKQSFLVVILLGYVMGITSHMAVIIIVDKIITKSTDDKEWRWIRRLASNLDRNIYAKAMAERAMFKNFSLVSIITLSIYIYHHYATNTLPKCDPKYVAILIIMCVVCGYFAYVIGGWINHVKENYGLRETPH